MVCWPTVIKLKSSLPVGPRSVYRCRRHQTRPSSNRSRRSCSAWRRSISRVAPDARTDISMSLVRLRRPVCSFRNARRPDHRHDDVHCPSQPRKKTWRAAKPGARALQPQEMGNDNSLANDESWVFPVAARGEKPTLCDIANRNLPHHRFPSLQSP